MVRNSNSAVVGFAAGAAVYGASAFIAPSATPNHVVAPAAGDAAMQSPQMASGCSWATAAAATVAVGAMSSAAFARKSAPVAKANADVESGLASSGIMPAAGTKIPIGKGGFIGVTGESMTVISACPKTGRASQQQVHATAMGAGSDTKVAIFGFGRIGRNVLRCWLKREKKPFDLVALNVGSMGAKTAAHLLKYDTVLGTLGMDVGFTEEAITVGPHTFQLVFGREPEKMPWGELGVDVVIESTGAFNSLDGGSKHLAGGAKKVVLTAPGKNCPTYVVGVNEGDYNPAEDTVISNASCTTNGMASVCKVLDESFEVQYGLMTTTHSYTGDQMILDGRHRDLRRARAGACNIVPTSTGAAKAVAQVLPKYKGKLNGIALRVPTPNVSVVDLVVKVGKQCTAEDVNAAVKKAADGPMKGIINFEEQPLVSSDFMQTDYSNSVDAALTMVMGGDLVKVVMWYDNEWGYSQRVLDMTQIVCDKPLGGEASAAPVKETKKSVKKSVEDIPESDLKGKKVLIRCDLNVPLNSDLDITDETRITSSIPTIKYLSDRGAKVIACSHLGRPKDGPEEKFSLKPVAKRMGELMGKDIKCAPDCKATDEVKGVVADMTDGDVMILENTRFYKGETKNDSELAESMASLADLFVNDAFGTAHRAHSSTEGVTKFLSPSVSGFLLDKELQYLKGAVDAPKRPFAAIIGGAKVSTKIPVIESMLDKVDKLIIGGGMVFTFLKARGLSVGNSLVEDDLVELVKKLEIQAKEKGVEVILPTDIACGDAFPGKGEEVGFKVVQADAIPDGWLGLDNGPEATEDIKKALSDCQTIIWNGPMGVFESDQFNKGTYEIANYLGELTEKNNATTIIGGGDSVAAVNKAGLSEKMSHISTGGGASLELLEGKVLPGVAALDDA